VLLHHPELIDADAPSEWPYDPDDLHFIAEHMNAKAFNIVMDEALNMESFASEELARAKKS